MVDMKFRFVVPFDKSIAAALAAQELSQLEYGEENSKPGSSDDQDPPAWTSINLKEYPRLTDTPLPSAEEEWRANIVDLLRERRSVRVFDENCYVPIQDLGAVLDLAARTPQENDPYHRPYPSAGARYPIEIYVIAIRIEELRSGVYHYDSHAHTLTALLEKDFTTGLPGAIGDHDVKSPSFIIVFTAIFHRSFIKYAGRGYRYALLEAGAIAQTLDLVCRGRGLAAVWLGGFPDNEVANLLDLNWELEMEAPVLLLAVGRSQVQGKNHP
ncbi:MAG: hypothetical protein QOF62_1822 [Pyrinomonadaceae bacterium]|jgi:SagB-type dehydrogenase family enzyme|nr:hypothetical protein [Pyrinomonadaceae bacterium]